MKKNTILTCLVSLMTISTIAGCNNESTNSSSSNSTVITSTNNSTESSISKKENIDVMSVLKKYKDGVKIDIKVNQTLKFLDSYYGDYTGKVENHSIKAEIIFQGGENKGFSSHVTDSYLDGFEYTSVEMKAYEGENGNAYYQELNYKNEVDTYDYTNSDGTYVNYNYYCLNPFSFVLEEDFTKVNDNTYSLSKSKSAFFAATLLGDVNEAYFGVIDKCEFVFEAGELKNINIVPHRIHASRTEGYNSVYYYVDQTAVLDIVEGGLDVKIDEVKPNVPENKDKIEKLQTALNKLKRDNYTLSLDTTFNVTKMEVLDEDEEKEVVKAYNYAKYYYTGNSLYYAVSQESNAFDAPNADNDLLLLDVGREKLAAYGYSETDSVEQVVFTKAAGSNFSAIDNVATYDQVTPKLNEVNASIFNYNEETNSYTICEEMMPYIASVAIVPPLTTFTQYLYDYGNGMKIFLTEDGNIDRVEFSFLYHDGFNYEEGVSVMTFTDIGTTELPFNLVIR